MSSSKLLVSIITVTKNSGDTLGRTIESVANQNYNSIEYIIIDGNSTDGTEQIVKECRHDIDVYIRGDDNGVFSAMNKGIEYATGDYIYFLNADDYLLDNYVIYDVVDFLRKHLDCDVVYGNIEGRVTEANRFIIKPPHPEDILRTLISGAMPHQATFASNRTFQKIGKFNENYRSVGDYEWWLRVASESSLIKCYFDRTIASYFLGGKSSNLDVALKEMFEVQEEAEVYQTDYWMKERIKIFQDIIRNPNGHWGLNRQESLAPIKDSLLGRLSSKIDSTRLSNLSSKVLRKITQLFE